MQLLISIAIILFVLSPVWGHKVNVFTYVDGGNIIVEGYFGGKAKAVDCVVEVLDADGKKILIGKTDPSGTCLFRLTDLPLVKGDISVVLHANGGHKATYTLRSVELPNLAASTSTPEILSGEPEIKHAAAGQEQSAGPVQDTVLLKKVVEEVLDVKLQPLLSMVSHQQKMLMEQKDKGPTITEIVAGIGWIFGLVGIAEYFMARNGTNRE